MLFALICHDKPDHVHVRMENRPAHVEHLKSLGDTLFAAGPLLADDNETMIGSLVVIEADTKADVETFATSDPYAVAGLFESVTITPWKKVLP